MRIAVSAESDVGLGSQVSSHFGRAPFFVLVEVGEGRIGTVTSVPNPFFGNHQPGQIPAFIDQQRAQVMISGGPGAGAVGYFNQFGIRVATGAVGSVGEAVQAYLNGGRNGAASCSEHHGCR